jgi:hypothetical protein
MAAAAPAAGCALLPRFTCTLVPRVLDSLAYRNVEKRLLPGCLVVWVAGLKVCCVHQPAADRLGP